MPLARGFFVRYPKRMAKVGRPTDYSNALCDEICHRIAEGQSLTAICQEPGFPAYRTVMTWLDRYPQFEHKYSRARVLQADNDADNIKDIAARALAKELPSDVARVAIDALKWSAGKRDPKKYGDRQAVELSGGLNFTNTSDEDLLTELLELVATGVVKLPEGVTVEAAPQEQPEADDWSEFA